MISSCLFELYILKSITIQMGTQEHYHMYNLFLNKNGIWIQKGFNTNTYYRTKNNLCEFTTHTYIHKFYYVLKIPF